MKKLFNCFMLIIMFLSFFLVGCFINDCFGGDYDREKQFGGWVDADHDGENTRQEVLIRDSLIPVGYDSNGNVNFGIWLCRYTGHLTTTPRDFDIDHLVSLKNAFDSGADEWNDEKRIRYTNYLGNKYHLVAVTLGSNREKGSKDISEWLPPMNQGEYIFNWIRVKREWDLCFNEAEIRTILLYDGIIDIMWPISAYGYKVCN